MNTISRANRLAAIERWNIPEVRTYQQELSSVPSLIVCSQVIDPSPPKINIAVTSEREDEDMSRAESQIDYDAELGKRSGM